MTITDKQYYIIPTNVPPRASFRLQRAIVHDFEDSNLIPHKAAWIFRNTVQSLYRAAILEKPVEIIVSTRVLPDGLGDWYLTLLVAQLLKKAYPASTISLFCDVEKLKERARSIVAPDPTQIETILWEIARTAPDMVRPLNQVQQKKRAPALKKLETSSPSLVLDLMSEYHSSCSLICKNVHKQLPFQKIFECGFGENSKISDFNVPESGETDHSFSQRFSSMGVGPFELGLAIKKPLQGHSFLSLEDHNLKKTLLFKTDPSEKDLHTYQMERALAFGYLKKSNHVFHFVTTSCVAASSQGKSIDIVCPTHEIDTALLGKFLAELELDIKEIQMIKRTKSGNASLGEGASEGKSFEIKPTPSKTDSSGCFGINTIPVSAQGKTVVRWIDPFPLSNHDMQIFIAATKLSVGCTGDMSGAETFSHDQLPFYGAPPHKISFYESVITLAEERFKDDPDFLVAYLKIVQELGRSALPRTGKLKSTKKYKKLLELTRKCGLLIADEKTKEQLKEFCTLIKTHYCFNEILLDIVSRHLARNADPLLREREDQLCKKFINHEITLQEGFDAVQQAIDKHNERAAL